MHSVAAWGVITLHLNKQSRELIVLYSCCSSAELGVNPEIHWPYLYSVLFILVSLLFFTTVAPVQSYVLTLKYTGPTCIVYYSLIVEDNFLH